MCKCIKHFESAPTMAINILSNERYAGDKWQAALQEIGLTTRRIEQ